MLSLEQLRSEIDKQDAVFLETLAKRFAIIRKIGKYKKEHNIEPFQMERWHQLLSQNLSVAQNKGLNTAMVKEIFEIIHKYSLQEQS